MSLLVTTIGDGAMATVCSQILTSREALAGAAAGAEHVQVTMWARNATRLAEIAAARQNRRYLPGVALSPALRFEPDEAAAFAGAQLIVCALPTQFIRPALQRLKAHIPPRVPVVSVAKGIEIDTFKRPSEIILEVLGPRPVAALSGPSIADELAHQLPATMVVAAADEQPGAQTPHSALRTQNSEPKTQDSQGGIDLARQVQQLFTMPYLRVYRNDDLLGVELAGALKNVIAIAAGMLDGMALGNNAKAALLTRGLVEITRLGVNLGAAPETFSGLAGLGDLVTTCVSPQGRNRTFGERIGRGEPAAAVLATMVGVVEGMPTCRSVVELARGRGIEMPISEALYAVLFQGRDPNAQLADLMSREPKRESLR